jgi:stalled ribosome rescue protein Dom34
MTFTHGFVWIDHREARIFGIGRDGSDEHIVHDRDGPKHIHRTADHVHLGKEPPDENFLGEVADALDGFKAIVIAGPGGTRYELAGFLTEHRPALAKRVWGIEPMDHPTDPQIVAAARKYFRAEDRMHG